MLIVDQLEKRKKLLSFLNSPSQEEIFTPVKLAEEMLDKLPKEVWSNPDLLWCDPCSKSGVFMLEVVIRLMKHLPIKDETLRYNHIINNMIRVYVNVERNKWLVSKMVYGSTEQVERVGLIDNVDKINTEEMPKFDIIVGNPPNKGSLHLKFLKYAVDILKDGGHIVWIHLSRWVIDVLAPRKKNSDFNKYKHLPFTKLKLISRNTARKIFNNRTPVDLSISQLEKNSKSILLEENSIFKLREIPTEINDMLNKDVTVLDDVIEHNKRSGIRVRIKMITPACGGIGANLGDIKYAKTEQIIVDGKIGDIDWTDFYSRNQYSKKRGSPIPASVKFNTLEEAQNYIDFTNTNIYLFLLYILKISTSLPSRNLPFMDDYTEKWDDSRLQKFFQISDDTMKYINDVIANLK